MKFDDKIAETNNEGKEIEEGFPKTKGIRINYPNGEKTTIIEYLDKGPIVVEDEYSL
ncbi:MAG: hypothetical protein IJA69_04305 [Clostridia bacterium]|nr:hypothetical protein [Clostridia bacterium]